MNRELKVWIDGLYKGIEVANKVLKEEGLGTIIVPSKEEIIKLYKEKLNEKIHRSAI